MCDSASIWLDAWFHSSSILSSRELRSGSTISWRYGLRRSTRGGSGSFNGRERLKTAPRRTVRAARAIRSGVSRAMVPSSSLSPNTPQAWRSPVFSITGRSLYSGVMRSAIDSFSFCGPLGRRQR